MGDFGKISIGVVIFLFVGYLVSHYAIGVYLQKLQLIEDEKPGNKENARKLKNTSLWFKWYPAVYLVFTLLVLYVL